MITTLALEVRVAPLREVLALTAQLLDIARQVFSAPPWDDGPVGHREFSLRLDNDAQQATSVAAVALDSDVVVGFAWLRQGCEYANLLGAVNAAATTELVEMAVLPGARGRGLGAALHDALLPQLEAGPALLVTHPAARPAMGLYRSRGWAVAGTVPSSRGLRTIMRRGGV